MKHRYSYEDAAKAMQVGVAYEDGKGHKAHTPKHLRVGVNVALVQQGALADLLIKKGVITQDEYVDAITAAMNREVVAYEERLSEELGRKVTLEPHVMTVSEPNEKKGN